MQRIRALCFLIGKGKQSANGRWPASVVFNMKKKKKATSGKANSSLILQSLPVPLFPFLPSPSPSLPFPSFPSPSFVFLCSFSNGRCGPVKKVTSEDKWVLFYRLFLEYERQDAWVKAKLNGEWQHWGFWPWE